MTGPELVEVPGGRLAVSSEGRADGPVVVLLHGEVVDLGAWDAVAALLRPSHRVVRYDARGHGASSLPQGDWSPAADLLAVLDHLGVRAATLVAHSTAAAAAVEVALDHPDRVTALLLVSPALGPPLVEDPYAVALAQERRRAWAVGDAAAWVEAVLRGVVDGPHRLPQDVDPAVRGRFRDLAASHVVRSAGASGSPLGGAVRDRLAALTAPVETVVGALDDADVHRDARLLAEAVPHARTHVVEGAGRLVDQEQPAALATTLLAFLPTPPS